MKTRSILSAVLAIAGLLALTDKANACYCGAGRYAVSLRHCCAPVASQCCTVMKTCKQVVYQQKQHTCYRTCYEPVWEQKSITATRYVAETQYRPCVQTVCKPVYETAEREVCYTVCKPIKQMQTIKVCSGRWETRTVEKCVVDPCNPCAPAVKVAQQCRVWVPAWVEKQVECVKYVAETVKKRIPYTVCKMVTEQRTVQVPYTVCKAVPYQTTVRCVRYVAKQVPYTVTRCEPVVVERQMPVQVCVPAACCGG